MIPGYITEEIDILSDTVLEIVEKAAYKAHGGTYVEGLWDASASTIVSKVIYDGSWAPMELNFHAGDIQHSYDPEVSDVPEYCRHSGLERFYGYTSEPPIAPAFREGKPVGLAAPALQALGTMQALLLHDGEDEQVANLNSFFCQMWGITEDELQNARYLQPELTSRSDIDLIKAGRGKTHRLYGYDNEQNFVSTHGGGYTRHAISNDRYIDWHRISLTLSFIGMNLLMSDQGGRAVLWNGNHTMYYGLVAREFPLITKSPHCPNLAFLPVDKPDLLLSDALSHAISYYSTDRIKYAIADRNRVANERVAFSQNFEVSEISQHLPPGTRQREENCDETTNESAELQNQAM